MMIWPAWPGPPIGIRCAGGDELRRNVAAVGAILLALSVALLIVAALQGEAPLVLLFVIPVLTITGPVGAAGALLLPVAIMVLFLSLLPGNEEHASREDDRAPDAWRERDTDSRWGGVIMIGPIPIVFGSAKRRYDYVLIAIAAAALLFVLLILLM